MTAVVLDPTEGRPADLTGRVDPVDGLVLGQTALVTKLLPTNLHCCSPSGRDLQSLASLGILCHKEPVQASKELTALFACSSLVLYCKMTVGFHARNGTIIGV